MKINISLVLAYFCALTLQAENVIIKPIDENCYLVNFTDSNNIKEAIIPKISGAIINLDGKLNESYWERSATLDDFRLLERKLKPGQPDIPTQKTTAKIFYTKDCIYIGVECFEKNIKKVKSIWKNYGDPVWNEDSIEIFLDTNYDRSTYYHLCCNSAGVRNSAYYGTIVKGTGISQEGFLMSSTGTKERKVLPDKPWPMSWRVATSKTENSWIAEIAIPFEFLGMKSAPKNYTVWGFNIGRERYAGKEEFSNWQKLGYGFHEVQYYGRIFFNKAPDFRIKSLKIKCPKIGKNTLKIFPKINNLQNALRIELETLPIKEKILYLLKYNQENEVNFNVDMCTKLLKISFNENGRSIPYHTYPIVINKIFDAKLSKDTISSDDETIEVICSIKLDKNSLKQSKLICDVYKENKKIFTDKLINIKDSYFKLLIPLKELEEGKYKIKLDFSTETFTEKISLPFEVIEF